MAENRKAPSYRGYSSLFLALASIASLLMFSMYVQPVYAVTTVYYSNSAVTAANVVRLNNIVFVSAGSSDVVRTYSVSGDTLTFLASIACTDCSNLLIAGTNDRVYARGPSTIHELDLNGLFVARTVSATCNAIQLNPLNENQIVCVNNPNDSIDLITVNVNPMTLTTGGSINSGVHACDTPVNININVEDDVAFVGCFGTTDRFVVLDTITSYGAQSPIASFAATTPSGFYDGTTNTGLACINSDLHGFTWDGTTLTDTGALTIPCIGAGNGYPIIKSEATDTFFVIGGSESKIYNIDPVDFSILDTIAFVTTFSGDNIQIFEYSPTEYWVGSGQSTPNNFWKFDAAGLHSSDGSIVSEEDEADCDTGAVAIDVNGDGLVDFCLSDTNGDGIVDFDPNDFPWSAGNPGETIPAFFQAFGLNEDSANLVGSVLIHILTIFGTAGVYFFKTHQNPPMFIWVAMLVFGGGISAAIGIMPLLYFFVEIALVVGSVAALVKTGVIGS